MLRFVLAAIVFSFGSTAALAQAGPPCKPVLAPSPETASSKMYTHIGPLPAGYVQQEYFVSCEVDGKPYKTLIQVRRPADTGKASGIVLAEVWHWSDLWTVYPKIWPYLTRKNDATVFIVSSPFALAGIEKHDPNRYGSLSIPFQVTRGGVLPQEFRILTQLGTFVKSGGIPGLKVRKLIMAGMSGSAGQVRHYIIQEGKIAKWNGASVYDGYFPAETAISEAESSIPDEPVPVVEIQGETELMRGFQNGGHKAAYRRPDGPLYRLYEVPGMSHISTRGSAPEYDGHWKCDGTLLSNFPQEGVYMAAFDNLVRWVDAGVQAPHAPRIETNKDGSVIMRDAYGNAKGGVRTSYFDVPVATYHVASGAVPQGHANGGGGARCDMIGNITPLVPATLKSLYSTHDDYVRKVNADLDKLVKDHWYPSEEAQELRQEAAAAHIP